MYKSSNHHNFGIHIQSKSQGGNIYHLMIFAAVLSIIQEK